MTNRILTIVLFMLFAFNLHAKEPYVCEGQYALCTTAKCVPIPNHENEALCDCTVQNGYSAGFKDCAAPKTTADGFQVVKSRYYPIKSYVVCANARPWANCLDSTCLVDKNNPSKAVCNCSVVQNKGDYVLTTESCDKSGCTSGIYSSILTKDLMQKFLNNQDKLPNTPAKVCD